jgi:hypothetical protein
MTDAEIETVAMALFRQFCRVVWRRADERNDNEAWLRRWNEAQDRVRGEFRAEARIAIATLEYVRSTSIQRADSQQRSRS